MKKIAFFIESDAVGGAERVLREIVKFIDKAKFDITVISLFKKSIYEGTSQLGDLFECKYKWIVNNENPIYSKWGNYLICHFPNLFFRLFVGWGYDTLVAFYEGMPTTFLARVKTKAVKIAWLHTSVDLSIADRSIKNLQRLYSIYSQYNKIVGVSKGVTDGFVTLFPNLKVKTFVAYNPIDSRRIKNMASLEKPNVRKNCFTFVLVGRVIPCKGYERIIEAAKELKKEGFCFHVWIIGGGGHAHLEQKAKDCAVDDFFIFWGNKSNPYPYMKEADCVVSSSYIEGLSTVLIEGLVLGKLIVATNCNGTEEILGKESEYGVLVENSERGLYEGLKKVLCNPAVKTYYEQKTGFRVHLFDVNNAIKVIEHLFV